MRVALLHPTYWPEVRRGSERLVHDLGVSLAERGHEVTIHTSHRSRGTEAVEEGVRVVRKRRPPRIRQLQPYEYFLENVPNAARAVLGGEFDVAHALFPSDAWAAAQAHRVGGPPVIFSFHGIATREYLVARRYRLEMLRSAVERSAATTVLSEAAAEPFRRYLLRSPSILPGGVFAESFAVEEAKAAVPTFMCAASLGDPRKRSRVLFSAFEDMRSREANVRLLVARPRDPVLSGAVGPLPAGAEWFSADRTVDLARAYAASWASVLPAVDEAFGLVLIESLAAGTPVVAARSGAAPELIDNDGIGRLFEPDDVPDLARAMHEAIALSRRPETAAACRTRVADYDWSNVVQSYESLYDTVA